MPRTKRDDLKRTLAQGAVHVEEAISDVILLYEVFQPQHERYAQLLEGIGQVLSFALENMGAFATHAWGHKPKDWDDWRK